MNSGVIPLGPQPPAPHQHEDRRAKLVSELGVPSHHATGHRCTSFCFRLHSVLLPTDPPHHHPCKPSKSQPTPTCKRAPISSCSEDDKLRSHGPEGFSEAPGMPVSSVFPARPTLCGSRLLTFQAPGEQVKPGDGWDAENGQGGSQEFPSPSADSQHPLRSGNP